MKIGKSNKRSQASIPKIEEGSTTILGGGVHNYIYWVYLLSYIFLWKCKNFITFVKIKF